MTSNISTVFKAFVVIILLTISGISLVGMTKISHHDNCTVSSKERVYNRNTETNENYVYTSCGIFTASADILSGNMSNMKIYGSLEDGNEYNFKTRGFNISILDIYPKIIEVSAS